MWAISYTSVACLVGYIVRVDRDKRDKLLIKGVRVWNVEVDSGLDEMCSC